MLPRESDFEKNKTDLIFEIGINQERVNAAGEGARKLYLENQRLHVELRQAELYVLALRERNQLETKLKEATRLTDRTIALEAEVNRLGAQLAHAVSAVQLAQGRAWRQAEDKGRLIALILGSAKRKALRDFAERLRDTPR